MVSTDRWSVVEWYRRITSSVGKNTADAPTVVGDVICMNARLGVVGNPSPVRNPVCLTASPVSSLGGVTALSFSTKDGT